MLIQNHKRVETAAKLKKAYSTLSQALRLSEIDTGLSAIDVTVDCMDTPESPDCDDYYVFFDNFLKRLNADAFKGDTGRYWTDNEGPYHIACDSTIWTDTYSLADGTLLGIERDSNETLYYNNILIDINGDKKPNDCGRDIFGFKIGWNNILLDPMGGCTDQYSTCTKKIANDGWEIKDDYPKRL